MKTRAIHGAALAIVLCFGSWSVAKDLIEPTRTLNGSEQTGRISIFSEPPEMAVLLNGRNVGLTPLMNHTVEVGTHVVTIGEERAELYVDADKPVRLSYFKGRFVGVHEKPVADAAPPHARADTPKAPPPPPASGLENPPSPFYWPINPRGPIY